MKHSESLANIGAALSKAQASVKIAIKDATNPHLKSKYADLGSVWEAAREALAENGLSVIQMPDTDEPGHIALETMILHSSGEYISSRARVRLQKDDAQGAGSGLTYLRRYALSAAMGIVADDDDGHAATHGTPAPAPRGPQGGQRQQSRPNTPPGPPKAQEDAPIGAQAARLESELKGLGVNAPLPFARKILKLPDLPDLTTITVKQARQLKHAAENTAA